MGKILGSTDSAYCQQNVNFDYTSALVTQAFYVANRTSKVVDIRGRPRVAGSDGSAVTLAIYKVPNGTAVANGTLLHQGTYDMKGTADTNQVLTLVGNQDSLTLQAGDALGYVLTGTATAAVGTFSVTIEPV